MLDGQLKQPVEGEEKTIPFQNLHPAHQVLSGTLVTKKQKIGQLRRPQVGLNQRPKEIMALPVLPRLALPVPPRHPSSPPRPSMSDKGTTILRIIKSDKGTMILREDKGYDK